MEHLPDDLVQCILRRLAVQDPLSLLAASCVCTSLHQALKDDYALWKEAFLAPVGSLEQHFDTLLDATSSAELDTEVTSLGGYKRLALLSARHTRARAHCMSRVGRPALCFGKDTPSILCKVATDGSSNTVAEYLQIFRLGGTVIGWNGERPTKNSPTDRLEQVLPSKTLPPDCLGRLIYTGSERALKSSPATSTTCGRRIGDTYDKIVETWIKTAGSRTLKGDCVVKQDLFIETYAFLDDVNGSGPVTSWEGRSWKWAFHFDPPNGVDYVLPHCQEKIFIETRAPDRPRRMFDFKKLLLRLGSLI